MDALVEAGMSARDVRQARHELAAAFRLAALHGWEDQLAAHFSYRLADGTFLLNPLGLMFDEITASSLMRVDMDGNVLDQSSQVLNPAAFTIHSAVYAARPDLRSVMHLHTPDGAAVSALAEGLLPLNQNAMIIHADIAYHDFEGIAQDLDERDRLSRDLGRHNLMILRNHGTLAAGGTIGTAFYRLYFLEWACTTQVRTLGMARALRMPGAEAQATVTRQSAEGVFVPEIADDLYWAAMLRRAERLFPDLDN
jgi:ribulose-5-phosphate 4-epimerase/fuculose-1-phosphate aldolase